MNYTKLVRRKKNLACPYCNSKDVHPEGRAVDNIWVWECKTCTKEALFKYTYSADRCVIGVKLCEKSNVC